MIETIIQEATDTHINVNPEQSKEVGFWSLEEDDGVTKVTCDVCKKDVENNDELKIHKETDHLEFKCDKCAFVSSTLRIVDDHKASMHVEISIIGQPEDSN